MRIWLPIIVMIAFFAGCSSSKQPEPYKPSTINVSKNAAPSKSTSSYPGADGAAPKAYSKTQPSLKQPSQKVEETFAEPYMETSISSTTVSSTTPSPSSNLVEEASPSVPYKETPVAVASEQKKEPVVAPSQDDEEDDNAPAQEKSLHVAAPIAKPINDDATMMKVAVLIPQKVIKKYAISTVNSVMAYMVYKNYYFDMNVYNSGDERSDSIAKALDDIKAGGYPYIIAPVTAEGAVAIANHVSDDTIVFIPTVHKSAVSISNKNIIFGGIDYDKQVAMLAQKANDKVGVFYDSSALSAQISGLVRQHNSVIYEKGVENSKANFRGMFKGNSTLNKSSLYLNTPLVTSSLIASQLRANDVHPSNLLSTQINYNPLFLTLTQYEDRNTMFIANSIERAASGLEEINTTFGHDIVYDWVNYSTSIGADYVSAHFFSSKAPRIFNEGISNNQVSYKTSLYQPGRNEFIRVAP